MKKIDVILQGIMIVPGIVLLLFSAFSEEYLFFVLATQLFLGPYQLFSSILRLVFKEQVQPQVRKLLVYYWVAAILSLTAVGFTIPILEIEQIVWVPIVVLIPWCIASFYLYISWIDTFQKPEVRSKFLPNIHI